MNITTDHGSLQKDDRVDALEQRGRKLAGFLVRDEEKEAELRKIAKAKDFIANPMGFRPGVEPPKQSSRGVGRVAKRRASRR